MELLFQESAPIPTHAMAAMAAVILGGLQLASAKGTTQHRVLGWSWALLMMYVSVSSLFISSLRLWGAFSPIHLLSVWTLFSLWMAIYHARKGNIRQHKIWMVLLYVLALLVTGLFTLWPGRVMHAVLFGA